MTAAEDVATASFKAELVAEGMVEHQADLLIVKQGGREFVAEVKLLDVTDADEPQSPGSPPVEPKP